MHSVLSRSGAVASTIALFAAFPCLTAGELLAKSSSPKTPEAGSVSEVQSAYTAWEPKPISLNVGETLLYNIKWSGIHAGTAQLSVVSVKDNAGHRIYEVRNVARSNRFVSTFYRVFDTTISHIDAGGAFSRFYYMSQNEGKYRVREKVVPDYDKRTAVIERTRLRGRRKKPSRSRVELELPGYVQDALSCLYALRVSPLSLGKELKMTVTQSQRNWVLTLRPERLDLIRVRRLGKFRAFRIKPAAGFPGMFVRGRKMTVWVEERSHIVLRMSVDIPVGFVGVTLVRAIKSPLNTLPPVR